MCNKISNLCVDPILATCVDYEGELGENTTITESCVNQNDVNLDLYTITDNIIEDSDLSELTSECINIPDNVTPKQLASLYEAKICELNGKIETLETINYSELDITEWGLTIPECIADSCGDTPTTLGPLLQAFMDQRNCT